MILVLNSGSSSLKYKLFGRGLQVLAKGIHERIGRGGAKDHAEALKRTLDALEKEGADLSQIRAVGHRVVHGGEKFVEPTKVTPAVLRELERLTKLAPLHNPANIMGIRAAMKRLRGVVNVAVFDTAFYRTLPDYAYMYALPYRMYRKEGIRKYGFHGISHRYVSGKAAARLGVAKSKLNLVTCHLGSGSSVTAVKRGKAIDTSMGFTPLEGLTMSTRCGDIDPAIPLYLVRTLKMKPDAVDRMMNFDSGLLGIAGRKDMRDVLAAAKKDDKARLAVDMFTYDVARYVAQFDGLLGGADAVVFTAGIGEHSSEIRNRVMRWLRPRRWRTLVIPTDEERMIAEDVEKTI